MPKTTLLITLIIQLITQPTLETQGDWIREITIFIVAVAFGSGLRIAMKSKAREKVDKREVFLIFFFGFSLGFVANYLLLYYEVKAPRPLVVWVVSLGGEFIVMWLEKRKIKILDKLFKKTTGIDLEDGQDND